MASPSDIDRADPRRTFAAAAATFVDNVAAVPADSWDGPGLGEWSVRDLVGHGSRSLITVEAYLGQPAAVVEVAGPVEYYGMVMGLYGNPADIVARGRAAGAALGDDPSAAVAEISERVLAVVAGYPDDALLTCPAGGMRLLDYLPTRTFELVVHTLDLQRSLGWAPAMPEGPLGAALELAAALAARSSSAPQVLLALTGRAPLPDGFSVV